MDNRETPMNSRESPIYNMESPVDGSFRHYSTILQHSLVLSSTGEEPAPEGQDGAGAVWTFLDPSLYLSGTGRGLENQPTLSNSISPCGLALRGTR